MPHPNLLDSKKAALVVVDIQEGFRNAIPDFALVDGRPIRGLPTPSLGLIKGDARSITIAAASILAKVTRDRLMKSYASMYPMYDWTRNKGYACPKHFEALREFGPTSFHRKSFKPVMIRLAEISGKTETEQLSLE